MGSITQSARARRERRRIARATLPWAELEAEAARQGCGPADVFFDRAGREIPGLVLVPERPVVAPVRGPWQTAAAYRPANPLDNTHGRLLRPALRGRRLSAAG